jgi:hypothetical protein
LSPGIVAVEVIVGLARALTTVWFEGKILRDGEVGPSGIGDAICCDILWDGFCEVRRGDEARGRGDGGTELRSGAIVACLFLLTEN